jgi:hypothetical protein
VRCPRGFGLPSGHCTKNTAVFTPYHADLASTRPIPLDPGIEDSGVTDARELECMQIAWRSRYLYSHALILSSPLVNEADVVLGHGGVSCMVPIQPAGPS